VATARTSKTKFVPAGEPVAFPDSKSTENLPDMIKQLNKEEKITFIFLTHNQQVVNKGTPGYYTRRQRNYKRN
jgi:putative ABC transport system ATP-binding protein